MREGAKQCRAKVQRSTDPAPRRCTHSAVEGGFCLKHGAAAKAARGQREIARALRQITAALPTLDRAAIGKVQKAAAAALKKAA